MAPKTSIVIFGDQTEDPWVLIRDLSRRSHHSPAAQSFLQCSSDALRGEIFELPLHERAAFQSFYSIVDLADKYAQRGLLDIAVSTGLHCAAHLGNLIM